MQKKNIILLQLTPLVMVLNITPWNSRGKNDAKKCDYGVGSCLGVGC